MMKARHMLLIAGALTVLFAGGRAIADPGAAVSGAVNNAVNGAVNNAAGAVSGAVNNAAGSFSGAISGDISGAVNNAAGSINGAVDNAVSGIVNNAAGAVNGAVNGAVSGVTGAVSGAVGSAVSGATSAVNGAVSGAVNSATSAVSDAAAGDGGDTASDDSSDSSGDDASDDSNEGSNEDSADEGGDEDSGSALSGFSPPTVGGGICSASCCSHCPPVPCDPSGSASALGSMLASDFYDDLSQAAQDLEIYLGNLDDDMMQALLTRLNQTELDIIDWWENTFWLGDKGLLASLKAMTAQLNTALVDQAREFGSALDASDINQAKLTLQKEEADKRIQLRPSEETCTVATAAGGYGRTAALGRAMRNGWQNESLAPGLNKAGGTGAASAADVTKKRTDDYLNLFCDPSGNGGRNNCGTSDPDYYNADTQPTKYIYNKLTVDVTDPKMAKTAEALLNNMVGVPAADPISKDVLMSATGQQTMLDRRAFLARYAAVRAVPQMIAGWRMPGGGPVGQWVSALREGAGIQPSEISSNPSYKEILHAVSVDRFNSGKYALSMFASESEVEEEKAILNAFYLMQLRDYYELLERTALTLAVQVSVMSDQAPLPDAAGASPLRQGGQ